MTEQTTALLIIDIKQRCQRPPRLGCIGFERSATTTKERKHIRNCALSMRQRSVTKVVTSIDRRLHAWDRSRPKAHLSCTDLAPTWDQRNTMPLASNNSLDEKGNTTTKILYAELYVYTNSRIKLRVCDPRKRDGRDGLNEAGAQRNLKRHRRVNGCHSCQ